jgi:hypothetical protein
MFFEAVHVLHNIQIEPLGNNLSCPRGIGTWGFTQSYVLTYVHYMWFKNCLLTCRCRGEGFPVRTRENPVRNSFDSDR